MTPQEVLNLFEYDRWATQKQLDVIVMLSEEQYVKDLASSYGSLRGTLTHIYAGQWIWHSRWRGVSPSEIPNEGEIPTFDMLCDRWTELRREIHEFTTGLTEEQLRSPLAYKDIKGNSHSGPLSHQIHHLINHSTYHRGQITTMLRQLGVVPAASIDLITYYREMYASLDAARQSVENT